MSKRIHSQAFTDFDEQKKKRVRRRVIKVFETSRAYLDTSYSESTPYERAFRQLVNVLGATVDTAFMVMRLARCSRYLKNCADFWWQSQGTPGLMLLCTELACRNSNLVETRLYENLKAIGQPIHKKIKKISRKQPPKPTIKQYFDSEPKMSTDNNVLYRVVKTTQVNDCQGQLGCYPGCSCRYETTVVYTGNSLQEAECIRKECSGTIEVGKMERVWKPIPYY